MNNLDQDSGPVIHKYPRDTEQMALQFITPKLTGLRLKALKSVFNSDKTGSEVSEDMGAWLYSVKPRLTELDRMGMVKDSGERKKNERNRTEIVWTLTTKGYQVIKGLDID